MTDKFYTEDNIATLLISKVPSNFNPNIIADFAVGKGILLEKAKNKWSASKFVANDLCLESIQAVQECNLNWNCTNFNFLDYDSIINSELQLYLNIIDLILINPPFSQKDKKYKKWEGCSIEIKSGTALQFVYHSLKFLKKNGVLLAILPEGCIYSKRDEKGMSYLFEHYDVEIIKINEKAKFINATPNIFILKIINKPSKLKTYGMKNPTFTVNTNRFNIFRGKFQIHNKISAFNEHGYPLIHTTNLKNSRLTYNENELVDSSHIISGPAILIPRVGNFDKKKVCYLPQETKVVISDCLFAIHCNSREQANVLKKNLLNNWDDFKSIYGGTGAVYTTLEKLNDFINNLCIDENEQ
nr:N-6 DNA methylase [Moraxella osloensis]